MATAIKTRCETVDQIVRWEDVEEGDLVLYNGRRELVTDVVTNPASMCVRFEGVPEPVWVRRKLETAVTRYIETEAPGR
jgi:hypothetical protein